MKLYEIRKIDLQALNEALGPVGVTSFFQQHENGYGDYTKEKYEQPELSIEEIDAMLRLEKTG